MTLDQSITLIGVLFAMICGLIAFLGKMVFSRLDKSEKRMNEIEINYNAKFTKVHESIAEVLNKVSETKHDVLNAIIKFSEVREKDKDATRDEFVTKDYCEIIHRQRVNDNGQ